MKNKLRIIIAIAVLVVMLFAAGSMALGNNFSSITFQIGMLFADSKSGSKIILAAYKDQNVTKDMFDFKKGLNSLSKIEAEKIEYPELKQQILDDLSKADSDKEIINNLITGMVLLDEAERLGFAATKEETDEFLSSQKTIYEKDPENAEQINSLCEGANTTLDEYWQNVEKNGYNILSRYNLKRHFREEYCKNQGIDYEKLTQAESEMIEDAYYDYRDSLLEAHKDDIKYYIEFE